MVSPIPFANAGIDGCPDSWVIDTTTRDGYDKLLEAKKLLGANMVLGTKQYLFSNYSGELGPMKKPDFKSFAISDVYLYGNTDVSFKVIVQVKNCVGEREFSFQLGKLLNVLSFSSPYTQESADSWATKNENLFQDFIAAKKFTECINNVKSKINSLILSASTPLGVVDYRYVDSFYDTRGGIRCGQGGGTNLTLVNLTPNCELVLPGNNERRQGMKILPNTTCKFAIAIYQGFWISTKFIDYETISLSSSTSRNLTILEPFLIKGTSTNKSIKCIRGNATKSVTGVNPKCPAGYKKK